MTPCIITATIGHEKTEECIASWGDQWPVYSMDGNQGMLSAYQESLKSAAGKHDILAYFHDDLLIHPMLKGTWQDWALEQFSDSNVGVVGFGGALRHGSQDLYKRPYQLQQLGRFLYRSNTDDAETHGERFDGSCEVAVLDGFALIVRRKLLLECGGWPIGTPIGYSLYDYWLCATAHRYGYRVRLIGVPCLHYGGMTAVGLRRAEGSGESHAAAHRYIYNEFADVLPWEC